MAKKAKGKKDKPSKKAAKAKPRKPANLAFSPPSPIFVQTPDGVQRCDWNGSRYICGAVGVEPLPRGATVFAMARAIENA